jgi:hypothetical protein
MFIGRIGADMILRLAWNCARLALTVSRPPVVDETSELPPDFDATFAEVFDDVLLLS